MYLLDGTIECSSRKDRVEIFPFYDCHIGKRNCAEDAIREQVAEIVRRSKLPNRHVRVLFGGDQLNAINTADVRRFDFDELADWFVDGGAEQTRERLGDMVNQEVKHATEIFRPIAQFTLGALTGNHEKMMRTRQNINVHTAFCSALETTDLTDECLIRLRFTSKEGGLSSGLSSAAFIYIRHGYGGGRTAGAEPCKIDRMVAEWECADVCLTGHSHSFCISPPKPVAYVPKCGEIPERLYYRYRFGANPGCWLYSHLEGPGSYESTACYPSRPMMTLKIVIWPFWHAQVNGKDVARPKIELREYPIL